MKGESTVDERKGKVVPHVPHDPWSGISQEQLELDLGVEIPAAAATRSKPGIDHPDGGKLPDWIAVQLSENGTTKRHKRKAEFHYCQRCRAIVLTGLDDDRAAMTATVDPTPLSPAEETAVLLAGRRTYDARVLAAGTNLDPRDRMHMDRRHPVVPAHQCDARFPSFITPPRREDPANEPIPF